MHLGLKPFARACFGNFFTRGKWASEVLPTEEIQASIDCVFSATESPALDGRVAPIGDGPPHYHETLEDARAAYASGRIVLVSDVGFVSWPSERSE